jgi:hypothetical protein
MPITVPTLDDRSFDDLYREVRARVAVHTPEWTNLTENDPGVTLLELFAFLTDNLGYRSNRIPEATRRTFLGLLGLGLAPATPARGFVQFTAEGLARPIPAGEVVRAGKVEFRTRRTVNVVPVEAHVFWKRPRTDLDAETLEHLRRLHEPFLGSAGAARLSFYDPVEIAPPAAGVTPDVVDLADPSSGPVDGALWVALAASETAVRAAGNSPEAAVAVLRPVIAGQTITLGVLPGATADGRQLDSVRSTAAEPEPGLIVESGAPGSAPTYQRLALTHADEVLDRSGVLDVQLPSLDRLTAPWVVDPSTEGTGDLPPVVQDRSLGARIVTWLRLRLPSSGAAAAEPGGAAIAWVGANLASVVQSTLVVREQLGTGSGAPDQRFRTAHAPVLLGDPDARPLLEVRDADGTWREWTQTDTLYASSPDETVYSLDAEAGIVSFGSGLHGFRPPLQSPVRLTYEHGGGAQGLVPIDAISRSDSLPAGITVRNPVATWGGAGGQTIEDGERTIPAWLRHRDRAVTAGDFRDIALTTPGVDLGRVDVVPLFDPRASADAADPADAAGAVTIMVVPRSDALAPTPPSTIDPHVLEAVCGWVDPRRLITTRVFVRGARWVPIVASVGIALMPGEVREEVEQRARAALADYLSPLAGGLGSGSTAADPGRLTVESTGASPTGWPLGVGVRVDDLAATVTRVAGVRYVEGVRLAVTRGGTTNADVDEVTLTGLELPFATVFVGVGAPEDPLALLGTRLDAPDIVPVPVIPKKC